MVDNLSTVRRRFACIITQFTRNEVHTHSHQHDHKPSISLVSLFFIALYQKKLFYMFAKIDRSGGKTIAAVTTLSHTMS